MTPSDFLIRGVRTVGTNSQETLIVFRSAGSSDPNIAFSGRGSFVVDKNDLPAGLDLSRNTRGNMLLTIESAPESSDDWPGGCVHLPFNIIRLPRIGGRDKVQYTTAGDLAAY